MARRDVVTKRTRIAVERRRGVFMISVAAELAQMHPQTLRMYEARGLIEPKRSSKGTRLYSQDDVERLRQIQEMTGDLGLNLAGVEQVMRLQDELIRMRARIDRMEQEMRDAIDRVHRQYRRDLVLYRPAQPPMNRERS